MENRSGAGKKKTAEEVTKSETISTIEFMESEGIAEELIRSFAKKKKISMKTVDKILGSNETKKVIHV